MAKQSFSFERTELRTLIHDKIVEYLVDNFIEDFCDENKIFLNATYYITFEFQEYDDETTLVVRFIERTGDYRVGDITDEVLEVEDGVIDEEQLDAFIEEIFKYE